MFRSIVPTRTSRFSRRFLTLAAALMASTPGPARAAFESARQAAMGDVVTARHASRGSANVAFRAVPPAPGQPRLVPLPLGLLQMAIAPPVFDPDAPDFSPLEIADLILNPPYDLRLRAPNRAEEATIAVDVGKDEIVVDLGEAARLIPPDRFERGGRFASQFLGADLGAVEIELAPLIAGEAAVDLSDDLRAALRDGTPIHSDGLYFLDQDAELQAAMSLGASVARQVAGPRPDPWGIEDPASFPGGGERGARVYAGAGLRFLLGLGYARTTSRLDVVPTEPLLDPDAPTDLAFGSLVRTSVPGAPGSVGRGVALDLGLVTLFGREWEVGIGANDVLGRIRWRTRVQEVTLDEATGALVTRTLAENEGWTSHLTPQVTLNVARHWGTAGTIGGDVRHGADGMSWHLGAERWLGPYVLRGGAILDGSQRLQGTGGGGVRFGPVGLDTSVITTSASVSDQRAVMLGLALALYR